MNIKDLTVKEKELILAFVQPLSTLEDIENTKWEVRETSHKLLTKIYKDLKTPVETPEQWIEEWVSLWPKGIRTGGKLIRSGVKECLVKMNKFVKEYNYDKEVIFKATKAYLMDRYNHHWEASRCATYFIYKRESSETISDLSSWCELILNPVEVKKGTGDAFRKSIN